MRQLSVEAAFGWVQRFAAREWPLLLPVALALFALPGLLVDVFLPDAAQLLRPTVAPGTPGQGVAMLALVASGLVYLLGSLTVATLALVPGVSVGEALARAVRRWPPLVGALLLLSAATMGVTVVLALLLGQVLGLAALQALLTAVLLAGAVVVGVRLAVLVPVLVDRPLGPVLAMRRSWAVTGAAPWRLLGALALYVVGGIVVVVAISSAVGSVVLLVARQAGAAPTGAVLSALVFRVVSAVVNTGLQLLLVGCYRQLAD